MGGWGLLGMGIRAVFLDFRISRVVGFRIFVAAKEVTSSSYIGERTLVINMYTQYGNLIELPQHQPTNRRHKLR